ncbi:Peptidase M28 [Kalmanozyma brasiliensis GHG001]|uniref:Peptide hydrolase n=1 Tax=Kalmanozyma brasiliensis (strain GHG001) TaxID=1365824 RepID=V5EP30_KALBG|nr:Peptidase M28 [Kalmanozyma brasiliensis GHG001]EST06860.1 Peptidase M28 [Kalmanozyma brasiliensis GHG001]
MIELKRTATVLLGALALASTTAVFAAPASTSQEWTYWLLSSSTSSLHSCASEVAKVRDASGLTYLYRASSHASCAQSLTTATVGPEEAVLFKPEAVEDGTRGLEGSWKMRALEALSITQSSPVEEDAGQVAFHLPTSPSMQLLSAHGASLVVAVTPSALATIDHHTTFDTRLQRLVFQPLSSFSTLTDKPEPKYNKPKHNSHVASILSSSAFNASRIESDLRILTGESAQPSEIGEWHSRHSATYGARLAGRWLKSQMEASLSAVNGSCEFWSYSPFFAPNIVCSVPASGEEEWVVVSAHYDSRGTFGSTTAPGGDDDGSGTSALLAIARALGSSPLALRSPVRLIFFSGEEQGLVGSSHYASALKEKVKLAIQMDMLAYRHPGEPLQLAFPDKFVTQSATDLVRQVAELYVPELEQGYTPACCSDHQSFWENNFPATWVFERNGPIKDPMYHNSGDVVDRDGYSVEQLRAIAKVVLASALHVAGFDKA